MVIYHIFYTCPIRQVFRLYIGLCECDCHFYLPSKSCVVISTLLLASSQVFIWVFSYISYHILQVDLSRLRTAIAPSIISRVLHTIFFSLLAIASVRFISLLSLSICVAHLVLTVATAATLITTLSFWRYSQTTLHSRFVVR